MKKSFFIFGLLVALLSAPSLLSSKTSSKGPLDPTVLNDRVRTYGQLLSVLQNRYVDSLDMEALIRYGIESMLSKIDPYTEYYDESNIEELTSISSGNYGGIGSAIQLRDSVFILSEPYFGKPARSAGVRHGDIILSIDGEDISPANLTISEVSQRLKGNPGTHVSVKVRRPWIVEGDSVMTFDIVRDKITIDPLPYSAVLDGGIGYFSVSTFNANTADEIRKAFSKMKATEGKNLKGVILDLRNNGGGIVDGAINLMSIFVDRGTPVAETRYRNSVVDTYKTRKGPVDSHIPMVVLINGNSASASEIVAGAVQDLDRGVIMGRRSYGKGLVQSSASLGNSAIAKFTSGKYYLPSGRLIQALDYSNRDENGAPALVPDSLTTAYKTANGRTVRDGRGIAPDVELEAQKSTQLAYQLYTDGWIDDFANRYRNRHDKAPGLLDTLVTDAVFDEFKAFVDPSRLKYGKLSQAGIEYLREAAKVEGLENDSIKSAIDLLETLMKHDLNHELDANREEIAEMLDLELASRYFDDTTISRRSTIHDTDLEKARQLLLDPERYRRLLVP